MEHPTFYRTTQVDGLSIFYREAGPKDAPTLLLLHGLPSSSRMFEPLFARLSDRYHLVAPDYPGFGHSDWPDPKKFAYTFDHYAEIMNHFTEALGLSRYTLYLQDYGAPLVFAWPWPIRNGSRLSSSRTLWRTTKVWERIGKHGGPFGPIALPTKARFAQISCRCRRRGRAMSGMIPMWNATTQISGPMNLPFSTSPARPTFKATSSTTTARTSTPIPSGRLGCARSSRGFSSSGANTTCRSSFRNRRPYRRDVPKAEAHVLDAGHFALDTAADQIAQFVRGFMK